jgi:hypothetical protein
VLLGCLLLINYQWYVPSLHQLFML